MKNRAIELPNNTLIVMWKFKENTFFVETINKMKKTFLRTLFLGPLNELWLRVMVVNSAFLFNEHTGLCKW